MVAAGLMAISYYPIEEDGDTERVRTSVRLPVEQHERVQFLADLWNALDKAQGKNTSVKWKASSVIERLVAVGLQGFSDQIGGWPEDSEQRAAMIAGASKVIAKLKR